MIIPTTTITAVILAGGIGRRMGGQDKGLVELDGRPLIEHIIDALKPQVMTILINANRNQYRYASYGYPVITDTLANYQGPLAGFAAGLAAADTPHILTVPCDGPLLPPDFATRMTNALADGQAELAVAHDGTRLQPVYALLPRRLLPSLQDFLAEGERKIDLWYARHQLALADFSDCPEIFRNINTPADRDRLQQESKIA